MNKNLLLLFLFSCTSIWSQIKFEKGYLIDNEDIRHEILIKNLDWLENPNFFTYKLDIDSAEKKATTNEVKEFQVYGYKKLVRYSGNINVSSNDINSLSISPEPELQHIDTFLYQISSGEKKLYSLLIKGSQNFFYSDENGNIQLLLYKKYHPNGNTLLIAHNNTYKNQLNEIFSDNPKTQKLIDYSEYADYSLIEIFNHQNPSTTNQNHQPKIKKIGKNNLFIKPGINFSKYKFTPISSPGTYDAELSSIDTRFSLEYEYIMPFNKNKWSFIFEAAYSTINTTSKSENKSIDLIMKYGYVELPIGIKYNMFLNDHSKIFTNIKIPIFIVNTRESYIKYSSSSSDKIYNFDKMYSNFVFGIGYSYKNKLLLEANASLKRSLTNYSSSWGDAFNYKSISLGYNLF